MKINSRTKIAALLKGHPKALETIVRLSPDFKKLRNPFLRRLMAGRTTIAMAAKIGGCRPEDFFQALKPLGFEWEDAPQQTDPSVAQTPLPSFLKELPADQLLVLDVREMLASGTDPLKLIQQTLKERKDGQVLQIVNSFEPTPLISLLGRQGFKSHVAQESPDKVVTWFYKEDTAGPAASSPALENIDKAETGRWDQLLAQFAGRLKEVDVRHLEMPQPMMTILTELDQLPAGNALYVQHKRIPVFLLDELAQREFHYSIREAAPGEVYLLIYKEEK